MKLSIIVPVYNEEKTIISILRKVDKISFPGITKEIIVIDDGSTDASSLLVSKVIKSLSHQVVFLQHKKNQGKGTAVRTGIKKATGDYIVIQDADLEYDPAQIKRLLQPVHEGKAQVVFGTRLNRLPNFSRDENKPLFIVTYLGNRFLSFFTSLLYQQWLTDMETCYKLFPRKAVIGMRLQSRGFEFEPEITAKLIKKGFSILEVPITTTPRDHNEGKKLRPIHDGVRAFWTLVKYRFS